MAGQPYMAIRTPEDMTGGVGIGRPHQNYGSALPRVGHLTSIFTVRGEMDEAPANRLQPFLANAWKGLLRGSMK